MDNASYATLARQTSLRTEMQVIAHNIANATTHGFQREGVIFSEFVKRHETEDTSLSMATARGRVVDRRQGDLDQTDGSLDFAIEGDGYFLVETPDGPQLTRAGRFTLGPAGDILASDGARLLDIGQAPLAVPQGAGPIRMAGDGTLIAGDALVGQVGVFRPVDPVLMARAEGVRMTSEAGVVAVETPQVIQGFLETSNVDPLLEVARMIEVHRAYERSSSLMQNEHDRMREVIRVLGQS